MLGSLAADTPHVTAAVPAPAVTVSAGACSASPLPLDATCSSVARRLFRDAAAGVGLSSDLVYDGATMASELAANSMHAQTRNPVRRQRPPGQRPPRNSGSTCAGIGGGQELVCKVFDALPRLERRRATPTRRAGAAWTP